MNCYCILCKKEVLETHWSGAYQWICWPCRLHKMHDGTFYWSYPGEIDAPDTRCQNEEEVFVEQRKRKLESFR
jgi:hypothetical protein